MSFIIGKKCISTCDTACVTACPVDCIHGPIKIDGSGEEVKGLDSVEGLQLFINPEDCIDCGAIYESEDDCIKVEGNDESVKRNYAFFGQEYQA